MDDQLARIDPTTDPSTAAVILRCMPNQVGPCPRCQGLTARCGPNAQVVCP
ncbi:hypothetical protein [Streptomyces sp. NPDC086519]|uniref:hypothetical protein n=1 Tax=Streptomyces sp. NPDC086519 TaxID=3154863 RepID=UPI003449B134